MAGGSCRSVRGAIAVLLWCIQPLAWPLPASFLLRFLPRQPHRGESGGGREWPLPASPLPFRRAPCLLLETVARRKRGRMRVQLPRLEVVLPARCGRPNANNFLALSAA